MVFAGQAGDLELLWAFGIGVLLSGQKVSLKRVGAAAGPIECRWQRCRLLLEQVQVGFYPWGMQRSLLGRWSWHGMGITFGWMVL